MEDDDHGKVQEKAQFGRRHAEENEASRDLGDEARQDGPRGQEEEEVKRQEGRRGAQGRDPQDGGAPHHPQGCCRPQDCQEARHRRPQGRQEGLGAQEGAQGRCRDPGGSEAGCTEPGGPAGAADDPAADPTDGTAVHAATGPSGHAADAGGPPGASAHEPGAAGDASVASAGSAAFDVDDLLGAAADADTARRRFVRLVGRPASAGADLYAAPAGRPAAVLFAILAIDARFERHQRRRQKGMT